MIVALHSKLNTLSQKTIRHIDVVNKNGEMRIARMKPDHIYLLVRILVKVIILVDADAVFLQPPDTIFDSHRGYRETGTLLFRDRLIYKDQKPDRHAWWRKEMRHRQPSATFLKSLDHSEGYGEEGESGVVVVDKGRLPVLLGLLHICWQNTKSVREEWTYKMTWGDKETWWFGYELTGVPYTFEEHYAAIVGTTR